jgi:hypothetical protein
VQRRSYLSIVVVGDIPFDLSNGPAFWVVMTIWVRAMTTPPLVNSRLR